MVVRGYEFLVFTGEVEKAQDNEQLLKDLEYTKGFLESVEKKLANEKFVANAKPEVLANEQKKRDDAIAKIKAISESLGNIKE
jgi:valyl-tRNA synthetase